MKNVMSGSFYPRLLSACVVFALIGAFGQAFADEKVVEQGDRVVLQDGDVKVTTHDVEMLLRDMTFSQRAKLSGSPDRLTGLVQSILIQRKQAVEAVRLELEDDPLIKWKMAMKRQQLLATELISHKEDTLIIPLGVEVEAQEYYEAHPEKFQLPERVNVAHILLKVGKGVDEKAVHEQFDVLLEKLKDGKGFSELAKDYSQDKGSAVKGGELGYFSKGKMVRPFEEAAFALENVGDVSGIVKTQFGLHILRLLGKKKASKQSFDDVKDRLVVRERQEYIDNWRNNYLQEFAVSADSVSAYDLLTPFVVDLQQEVVQKK